MLLIELCRLRSSDYLASTLSKQARESTHRPRILQSREDIVWLDSTVTCARFMDDVVGEWRRSAPGTRGWSQTNAAFSNGRIKTMSLHVRSWQPSKESAAGCCHYVFSAQRILSCVCLCASGMLYLADYASSGKYVACVTASESADGRYVATGDDKCIVKLFDRSRVDNE